MAYLSVHCKLRIINSNKALADLIGCPRRDILDRQLVEFPRRETVSALERFLESPKSTNGLRTGEAQVRFEDGAIVVLELYARAARRGNSCTAVIHCILSDATEKKRAAEARRRSEDFLRQANDELERRVLERTGELLETYRILEEEIASRKRTEVPLRESEERSERITDIRTCWAPKRIRPKVPRQVARAFLYVYAAVCMALGKMTSLILPYANTDMMNLFLEKVSHDFTEYFVIMLVDGA